MGSIGIVLDYICNAKTKVVEISIEEQKIKYTNLIKNHERVNSISGNEELVRAYLVTKLVNELEYKPESIEIEKEYNIGRPKVKKARIDLILKDKSGNPFFFIEAKAPEKFESDKEYIKDQLFSLSALEAQEGKKIKYLVYYSIDVTKKDIVDNAVLIDFEKYKNYESWESAGYPSVSDELPARYEKAQKEPLIKGGRRDLISTFTTEELEGLRKNLHNVLWGGGSIGDNEIFSSLVNIILAKIQDENEREKDEKYEFQVFSYGKNGEELEDSTQVFNRINKLYQRALKERLNIEDRKVSKANVINEEKFSLNKLLYVVQQLEKYSFVDGKESFSGKDILGEFFEGIIREGFKQTKGQFFTPINIVRFILYGLELDNLALNKLNDERELPYIIDPACGSGTFLIEAMKTITNTIKYKRRGELKNNRYVIEKFEELFMPDYKENRWGQRYLYGIDTSFDLGTATKVNMILHGDGSTNIFIQDGLRPFRVYTKETTPNILNKYSQDALYYNKDINGEYDVVISNPPFSVELDKETKNSLPSEFLYGDKKNSENLFVERWYQLLKENGRLGVVLPESVFDTTENKYIRLFIYRYFKVKAIVSLPQLTFEPFTSTKTSLLFAQKKTKKEIGEWNEVWNKYSTEWNNLKIRCENLMAVYLDGKDRKKLSSINNLTEKQEEEILQRILKDYIKVDDTKLSPKELIQKYTDELKNLCKYDADTTEIFGFANTWWVFGEVAKELNYTIFMAEVENIGYKRTKRGEKPMPNELYRTNEKDEVMLSDEDKKFETALDYMRKIQWD